MFNFLSKFFGTKSQKDVKELIPYVTKINQIAETLKDISNDELRNITVRLKNTIKDYINDETTEINNLKSKIHNDYNLSNKEKLSIYKQIENLEKTERKKIEDILLEILPEAFAVMKETTRRFTLNDTIIVTANDFDRELAIKRDYIEIKNNYAIYKTSWTAGGNKIRWDMIYYDVQLIGGIVLHQGKIAEMATGEGKTLVATLPLYLNALTQKGVHVVTVNDYLAKRDSEWMGPLFEFHGISVDCIDKHEPHSYERKKAYNADITYGTNNEFGFDYLRDNMTRNPDEIVQRKLNYAIVDEVDSVLIDDARTPLIISGPTPKGDKQEFDKMKPRVEKIYNEQKNLINKILNDFKRIYTNNPTPDQLKEAGKLILRAYRGLPKNKNLIKLLSDPQIKILLQKTEAFYMQDQNKNMHIIDDELFFVIDEKLNSIELTDKGIELITGAGDDPKFFIIPDVGTELAELEKSNIDKQEKLKIKEQIIEDYAIKSERIHTVNQLLRAYTMYERDVEYVIIDNQVKIVDEQTGRILEGRRYSDGLHQAIEAKENVKIEAATQTYATITLQNYFRMYNKLAGMTGTAETEAGEFWEIYKLDVVVIPTNKPVIRIDNEDKIYRTKREKYKAVIEECEDLINKNRPVLIGTTSVEVSELLSKMLKLKGIKHNVLNAKLHKKEADIVAEAGQARAVTIATNMAGRGTDIKLGKGVVEAGGLAIIGTERHESRRVDRQLRGRAGRQGDPGSSQFFVSLEDDLMRLFGSDRIARIMNTLGLKEGEVIQHSMITKSIERAQRKVEENNFGIRKRLLEYDDVMNSQRDVIYNKRHNALFGDKLSIDIENMMEDLCETIVNEALNARDFQLFKLQCIKLLGIDYEIEEKDFFSIKPNIIIPDLFKNTYSHYQNKRNVLREKAFPFIKNVYENFSQRYENIVFPITDGKTVMNVIANLKKSYESNGNELINAIEKNITIDIIDNEWKEHLRELDDLKQSVQNAAYEQKDPLLIYKLESFNLFKQMIDKINREIISFILHAEIALETPDNIREGRIQKTDMSNLKTTRNDNLSTNTNSPQQEKNQPVRVENKVGRNDPCPCGSGLKYKNCHGKNI